MAKDKGKLTHNQQKKYETLTEVFTFRELRLLMAFYFNNFKDNKPDVTTEILEEMDELFAKLKEMDRGGEANEGTTKEWTVPTSG